MLSGKCKLHLKEVNETGLQHMVHALWVALRLQLIIPAVIIHAFAPRFFTRTGTNMMNTILKERK
jgi:hypothetical protein